MKKSEKSLENTNDICRKEAIKKMGKYAALTAMGTFMILSPKKAQAQSPPPDSPTFPGGFGGG
jgi:hypothetical protein